MKKLLLTLALSLSAHSALAISVTGLVPAMVGLEGNGSQVYVGLANPPSGCTYGGMYFNGGTIAERKAVLATALAAKLAGKTMRIDFTQAAGGVCYLGNLYVE